jgi:hypothetical protein
MFSCSHGGEYEDNSLLITLIMEAVHTSETSVYFNETTHHYIPEDCYLHTSKDMFNKCNSQYECVDCSTA